MTQLFEHRHYVEIARIIATFRQDIPLEVAQHFAHELEAQPGFQSNRFIAAAVGKPQPQDR
jgi:hypothetical protein